MSDITIHSTVKEDFEVLYAIDHSFHTEYVWQMDLQSDEVENVTKFRTIRLPRSMRVEYPYHPAELPKSSYKNHLYFTAKIHNEIAGYCNFVLDPFLNVVRISDLIIERRFRRKGVGFHLLNTVCKWGSKKKSRGVQILVQSKNYPAIQMLSNFGFEYSGYNDKYYDNHDIAVIFSKRL